MNDKDTKIVGLIVNLFFPGIGTIIAKKTAVGIAQLIIAIIAIPLCFLLIGIPLLIIVWLWAVVGSIIDVARATK